MRRLFQAAVTALFLGVLASPPASAQQSLNLALGGFVPRGETLNTGRVTGRDSNDVLAANSRFLAFDIKDFRAATVGAEWLIGFGDKVEGSLGVGFNTRTVPTVYIDYQNRTSSGAITEIEQDLQLRVVPFTATVRFLPIGRHEGIVPYLGAGVAVLNYRYTESGQFVDNKGVVFSPKDSYVGSGSATGPVILGGLRVPIGNWGVGGEVRWQSAQGTLQADQNFAGSKIDLGGVNYLFTVTFRF